MNLDISFRPRWTFAPADAAAFARSRHRVFLVGPEPNGDNYPPNQPKDMSHFFREGLRSRGFGNVKFLRATLLCLEGVLRPLTIPPWPDWWEDLPRAEPLLDHLLFLDLKPIEGGGRLKAPGEDMKRRVSRYVKDHPEEVLGYWEQWRPTHTVLLGRVAQRVFEGLVAPELLKRDTNVRRVGWPHPSANGYHEAYVAKLQTGFRALGRPVSVNGRGGDGYMTRHGSTDRKPAGFWKSTEVQSILEKYVHGQIGLDDTGEALRKLLREGFKISDESLKEDVKWYARETRKRLGMLN
jgi:hypothetical protein